MKIYITNRNTYTYTHTHTHTHTHICYCYHNLNEKFIKVKVAAVADNVDKRLGFKKM